MCGIAGFWDLKARYSGEEHQDITRKMISPIVHRGPDSHGIWSNAPQGISLGHRRLSIIDLTEAGHQPMVSTTGWSILCYNGEVYNADDIRHQLEAEGVSFKSHSDTEVVLEACEKWGVEKAVTQLIGMFAFAFFDQRYQKLYLVRDRLGVKPLFWAKVDNVILFGSELKTLKQHPSFNPALNTNIIPSYFRFNYVPAPYTIYKHAQKQRPATILSFTAKGEVEETVYWNFSQEVNKSISFRNTETPSSEILQQFDALLKDSIKLRMVSDVPFGAFLSGGIDSSLVVAVMQSLSSKPIKTFSIGFEDARMNEATYAKAVAKHLGTDHYDTILTANQAAEIIQKIPSMYDEPFADSSAIPTYLVSNLASQHVKVVVSGDGGDELFSGYTRYQFANRYWSYIQKLPYPFRDLLSRSILSLPTSWATNFCHKHPQLYPFIKYIQRKDLLKNILKSKNLSEMYLCAVSQTQSLDKILKDPFEMSFAPWDQEIPLQGIDLMQYMDTLTYLPDDILVKVDRASMANSIEAREPLLDHRLVSFAWQLPQQFKIRNNQTKWILKHALKEYVPQSLIDRPKMGFGIPLDEWLRGPLKEWAESLLSKEGLGDAGIYNVEGVQNMWAQHQSRSMNHQSALWGILMFNAWHRDLGC